MNRPMRLSSIVRSRRDCLRAAAAGMSSMVPQSAERMKLLDFGLRIRKRSLGNQPNKLPRRGGTPDRSSAWARADACG